MTRIIAITALVLLAGCATNAKYVKTHNCTLTHHHASFTIVENGREAHYPPFDVYSCPNSTLDVYVDSQ